MKKLVLITAGCLIAIGARLLFVLVYPTESIPLQQVMRLPHELGVGLTAAHFVLFVTQIGFALVLAQYNLRRPNDLVAARLLWTMAIGWMLKGFCFLCLGISVWFPLYWAWAASTILAALIMLPALYYYWREMEKLEQRRPMRELEGLIAKYKLDEAELNAQQKAPELILREVHDRLERFFNETSELARGG